MRKIDRAWGEAVEGMKRNAPIQSAALFMEHFNQYMAANFSGCTWRWHETIERNRVRPKKGPIVSFQVDFSDGSKITWDAPKVE